MFRTLIAAVMILPFLISCETGTQKITNHRAEPAPAVSDFCLIEHFEDYDPATTSPANQAKFDEHNARYVCVCERETLPPEILTKCKGVQP